MRTYKEVGVALLLMVLVVLGCKMPKSTSNSNTNKNENSSANKNAASSPGTTSEDGTISSGTGEEKEKPSSGKGNVQGKVFYNEKPVAGVEVKACSSRSSRPTTTFLPRQELSKLLSTISKRTKLSLRPTLIFSNMI